MDTKGVSVLLAKLESKMSVGELLALKAKAQGLEMIESVEDADIFYSECRKVEVYD